jgi:hypothetical protein
MAKNRLIKTKFWSDSFIVNLEPIERYLYLYLLTNEHTNLIGIYEISERTILFETSLTHELFESSLKKLLGKIFYIDNWMYIKNFSKHQNNNDSVKRGMERELELIPKHILAKIAEINTSILQAVDRLSTECDNVLAPCGIPNLNLNLNLDLLNYIAAPGGADEKNNDGNTTKKNKTPEENKLYQESKELVDYWRTKWESGMGNGKKATVLSWARCIKTARVLLKIHGLERMKLLCDLFFITDDEFFKKNGYGINIFFMDSTINKLSTKI